MYQHPPNATRPATSVHHKTARASHSAFPSCCHASPFRSQYLMAPTSNLTAEPGITAALCDAISARLRRNT